MINFNNLGKGKKSHHTTRYLTVTIHMEQTINCSRLRWEDLNKVREGSL